MTPPTEWVPGVQLRPNGPVIDLPSGWSVGASGEWGPSFWAWSADEPLLQLGYLAAGGPGMLEVDDWAEQVASELVDGRTVSIDEASDGSVTLVWHWLNMGISSIHVQSRPTQGDPSGVLCGGTPAVLLGEFISLFNEYLRRGAISLATGSPPMLSDMLP